MAAYEVLLLNTAIPQIQAAQSGDTYVVPRDIAINATAIISANSATDALRITQTGAGNAILVEDSSNPDATPFVVTATGDVGIGTTSPFNPVGSGMTSLTVSGTTYGSLWIQANSAAVRGSFNVTSANNTVNLTAYTNHPLTFATDDKERGRFEAAGNFLLRQSSNAANTSVSFNTTVQDALTLDSSGNLGVGTTNPAVRLHVSDTPSSNNGTIQLGSAIYYGTIQHDAGVTGANIYNSQDNGGHLFRNSGSTVLTLNNSGNLGLGVTPSNWNTYTAFQVLGGSVSNYNTDDNTIYASNIYYGGSPSAFRYVKTGQTGTMYRQNTGAHTWHTTGTTTGTANAEASALSQAMTLLANGNLGIGETNPAARLDVRNGVAGEFVAVNALNTLYDGATAASSTIRLGITNSAGVSYATIKAAETSNDDYPSLVFGVQNIVTTNPTERARITSGGNFLVGTQTSYQRITVGEDGSSVSTAPAITFYDVNSGGSRAWCIANGISGAGVSQVGALTFSRGSAAYTDNPLSAGVEVARFTAGGAFRIATTGTLVSASEIVSVDAGATNGLTTKTSGGAAAWNYFAWNSATSGDNGFIEFGTEGSYTARGSITYNRTAGLTSYNTTSDYRAKDIIGPVANSGATIDALKVYEGKMKGATQSRPMLVAHEAQEVAPYAVTGEKDAVNEDGTPKYQQMDVSSLVPLLLAEIQSLRARVKALEGA